MEYQELTTSRVCRYCGYDFNLYDPNDLFELYCSDRCEDAAYYAEYGHSIEELK